MTIENILILSSFVEEVVTEMRYTFSPLSMAFLNIHFTRAQNNMRSGTVELETVDHFKGSYQGRAFWHSGLKEIGAYSFVLKVLNM